MATTNALVLNEKLSKAMGDWIQVAVTTNIAADTKVISTNLNEYDGGSDAYFAGWWLYVTDHLNAGKDRKVRFYYTANGVCNVFGAVFTAETTNVATVRLSRYSFTGKQRSLNDALFDIYPSLHKRVVDVSSITNNNLYTYPLPTAFDGGAVIHQVQVNCYTSPATAADEDTWRTVRNWNITNEGHAFRLPVLYTDGYQIRLTGISPLETVSAASDAVNIAGREVDLLIAYAKYKHYEKMADPVASEDIGRYESASAKAYGEYKRLLPKLRMPIPATPLLIKGRDSGAFGLFRTG